MARQMVARCAVGSALVAVALALTAAGSCSSVEKPDLGGTGGTASGGGGTAASSGSQLGAGGCAGLSLLTCVTSCATRAEYAAVVCDERGFRCPDGAVPYASCPAWSCARWDAVCCNGVTGQDTDPACQPDGLRAPCAAGARPVVGSSCIPDDLGVTSCVTLDRQSCSNQGQKCWSSLTRCECLPADGGLTWECSTLLI